MDPKHSHDLPPQPERPVAAEPGNRVDTMSQAEWVGEVVDKILTVFPNQEVYTCAAGISPSGTVHFGNFRDVMTSLVFLRELQRRGKKTRLLFSWDDFDRLRKIPSNVDPSFSKHIGMPLTAVPDPAGKESSYARSLEVAFEESMRELGIELEYRYQSAEYASGRYDEMIVKALRSREKIARILLASMSDKGKAAKSIDEDEYAASYYPISVYSRFTGRDNTRVLSYDGDSTITYECLDTHQSETVDLRKDHVAKLSWKVDWPMRWGEEGVVFEPGGHDHASPGGSYDTSSVIAREVFGVEPPVFVGYQFIGIRGMDGKMSGSKGDAITPGQLLRIYAPDLLKWLYTRKNPHQPFDLAFDSEVIRQYDEYDRAMKAVDATSNPIPFRQAVSLGQILQWDREKILAMVEKLNLGFDATSVVERIGKAKAWLEEYNPGEMIVVRDEPNAEYAATMDERARGFVSAFAEFVCASDFETLTIETLEEKLYAIPKVDGLADKELKAAQRDFFKALYQLLIGKDTGPRLSTFIWALGKERVETLIGA